MDTSQVQTIVCLTADYGNSLLPLLTNITSFHLHAGLFTVTKLIVLIPFPYPHTNASFIFKIKKVKLEKPWLDMGLVLLLYNILFKSLFSLSLLLLPTSTRLTILPSVSLLCSVQQTSKIHNV